MGKSKTTGSGSAPAAGVRRASVEGLEPRRLMSADGTAWYGVDSFSLGGTAAVAEGITKNAAGDVFVVGYAKDSGGVMHGIVREKAAGSSTWGTVYNVNNANFDTAAVGPDGTLYVAGRTGSSWAVFSSRNGGALSVVDSVSGSGESFALAVDSSGDVFASGYTTVTVKNKSMQYWTVREMTAGATGFHSVDQFNAGGAQSQTAYGITVVNGGTNAGIYVGGTASYATLGGVGQWVVRKSGDGGGTWSTVDKYTYNGVNGASSFGLTSDAVGNVFATGNAGSSTGGHWVTRMSSNGGGSWGTIDDWQYVTGQSTTARAVGFDGNGNLITVGGSGGHALARTLVNGTWTVVDDYVGGSYTSVGTDNLGYTYAAGNSTGSAQWIVRDPPPASSVFSDVLVGKHHGKHRHH